MIAILISWICIFIVFITVGDILSSVYRKATLRSEKYGITDLFILGMCSTSALLAVLSVFFAINHFTLLLFIIICIVYWTVRFEFLKKKWDTVKPCLKNTNRLLLLSYLLLGVGFLLFPVWSFGVKIDPFIYHYSNIIWNESYPVIPGLANLDEKFGFNSNYFLLQSCFSFRFLFDEVIVGLQSLLAFLMASSFLYQIVKANFSLKQIILFLLYFVLIYLNQNELPETSTDIIPTLIIFYVFTKAIINPDLLKKDFLFFIIVPISIITFKLSASLLVLMSLISVYYLFKNENYKTIAALFIFSTVVIILPWLVRNVIVSGYIIFPLYELDLFSFDWKVPAEIVKQQKDYIHNYAVNKTINVVKEWDINNYYFYSTVLLLFVCVISITIGIVNAMRKSREIKRNLYYWAVYIVLLLNLLFWFLSAPDVRFGYGYIFAVIFFAVHSSFPHEETTKDRSVSRKVNVCLFAICLFSAIWGFYGFRWASKYQKYLVKEYAVESVQAWKEALICPMKLCYLKERVLKREDERYGYNKDFSYTAYPLSQRINLYISSSRLGFVFDKLPAVSDSELNENIFHDYRKIESRGENVEDGFRYTKNK